MTTPKTEQTMTNQDKVKKEELNKWRKNNPLSIKLHSLKQRCNDPKYKAYKWYGGKGVKCLLSLDDLKFLWNRDNAGKLKRPSIDRINPCGNYELSNCRFVEFTYNSGRNNREKTHCPSGHEYTKENTLITTVNGRVCRECRKILKRMKRRILRQSTKPFQS